MQLFPSEVKRNRRGTQRGSRLFVRPLIGIEPS
jgi:hypothetical protein